MFPVPVQPRPRSRIPELDEPRSSHNAVRTYNTVCLLGSLCSRSQRNCAPGHRRLLPPQSRAITFLCSAVHILLATRVPLPKSCSGQRLQRPTVGLLLLTPTRTDFGALVIVLPPQCFAHVGVVCFQPSSWNGWWVCWVSTARSFTIWFLSCLTIMKML